MIGKVINLIIKSSGICKIFAPTFKKISEMDEFNSIKFEVLETDDAIDIIDELQLKYVPTIIVYDENNNVLTTFCGATCSEELIEYLKNNLK